jgi:hypothetical protein
MEAGFYKGVVWFWLFRSTKYVAVKSERPEMDLDIPAKRRYSLGSIELKRMNRVKLRNGVRVVSRSTNPRFCTSTAKGFYVQIVYR